MHCNYYFKKLRYFLFRFPLTRYELVTSVDFKKCDSKAATCAKLVCPKSKISQLAALIGQDASEKVKMQIHSVTLKEII